jgi:hypothetical protein
MTDLYYDPPEFPCGALPPKPAPPAPWPDCDCDVCRWAQAKRDLKGSGPIKPGTREWDALMEIAS